MPARLVALQLAVALVLQSPGPGCWAQVAQAPAASKGVVIPGSAAGPGGVLPLSVSLQPALGIGVGTGLGLPSAGPGPVLASPARAEGTAAPAPAALAALPGFALPAALAASASPARARPAPAPTAATAPQALPARATGAQVPVVQASASYDPGRRTGSMERPAPGAAGRGAMPAMSLRLQGMSEGVTRLRAGLPSQDPAGARVAAALMMGELEAGPPSAAAAPAAGEPVPLHRRIAGLERLVDEDPERAMGEVSSILSGRGDDRPEVREAAAEALARLKHPGAAEAARSALGRYDPRIEEGKAKASSLKPEELNTFLRRDSTAMLRREAARVLGARAGEWAAEAEAGVAALQRAWDEDPVPAVRLMAGWALERYGRKPGPSRFEEAQPKPAPAPGAAGAGGKAKGAPMKLWHKALLAGSLAAALGLSVLGGPRMTDPAELGRLAEQAHSRAPTVVAPPAETGPVVDPSVAARHELGKLSPEQRSVETLLQLRAQTDLQGRQLSLDEKRLNWEQERVKKAESGNGFLSSVGGLLVNLLLFVALPIGLMFWFMKSQGGGSVGRTLGNLTKMPGAGEARPMQDMSFADVAGVNSMREIWEIAEFLKDPEGFARMGARVPKGVLLEGPPGTGKTLLARALAGEAKVPFYSASGSDFNEVFVGVGSSRVRDLFDQARKNAPAILFIDELDALGRARGAAGGLGGGSHESDTTLTALLTQMDGFFASGVIVLAATNRADVLDPALTRAGRFDRQVYVGNPDLRGRKAILGIGARPVPLDPAVDLEAIARRTTGMSGAALVNAVNEAAIRAKRRGLRSVTNRDLHEAITRDIVGEPNDRPIPPDVRLRLAVHEMGHIIAQRFTRTGRIPLQVTIVPRGQVGGFAEPDHDEDRRIHTRSELIDVLVSLVAAKRAEELFLGESSDGASNDLDRATKIAREMVERLGMGEKTGLLTETPSGPLGRRSGSEATARIMDEDVKALIDQAWAEAGALLERHKAAHTAGVAALLEKETLFRDDIEAVIQAAEEGNPGR